MHEKITQPDKKSFWYILTLKQKSQFILRIPNKIGNPDVRDKLLTWRFKHYYIQHVFSANPTKLVIHHIRNQRELPNKLMISTREKKSKQTRVFAPTDW